jgi:hypothetical protein
MDVARFSIKVFNWQKSCNVYDGLKPQKSSLKLQVSMNCNECVGFSTKLHHSQTKIVFK